MILAEDIIREEMLRSYGDNKFNNDVVDMMLPALKGFVRDEDYHEFGVFLHLNFAGGTTAWATTDRIWSRMGLDRPADAR